uniref:5'-deoxynucleotidase HDDC2 n=1 Tax=Glossina brevipalpis TaxID=37001 RepID=A0A1A9W3W8_9MUSC
MFSIQQLIKTLKKLQNNSTSGSSRDVINNLKRATITESAKTRKATLPASTTLMTSLTCTNNTTSGYQQEEADDEIVNSSLRRMCTLKQSKQTFSNNNKNNDNKSKYDTNSSQLLPLTNCQKTVVETKYKRKSSRTQHFSIYSDLKENASELGATEQEVEILTKLPLSEDITNTTTYCRTTTTLRNQRIQNFYQQQLLYFHTQQPQNPNSKQKQATKQFAMSSSLAAEPAPLPQQQEELKDHQIINEMKQQQPNPTYDNETTTIVASSKSTSPNSSSPSSSSPSASCDSNSASGKPCFNAGLSDILQFMELIGNLKHTKRTGWVLRDVNDCESISGHMYRMSILTFLLDGSEGLDQIRCMELALVHDLAESLVGDITPFCGVSKNEKRALELKAMQDICKLIEPRGKRIMELFEEYELGESAESRFVKDLDRLDMVMQAFEYEKRDNCLLKHQEFFDSTAGKFNHPFVKKLVNEINEQRNRLAKAKGASPPPKIEVPDMEENNSNHNRTPQTTTS